MSGDIVARLRDPEYAGWAQHLRRWDDLDCLHAEAAAEIERLRAALKELDAMYRRIAPDDPEGLDPDLHPAWKACKAALAEVTP